MNFELMKQNELQNFKKIPAGWTITTLGRVLPISYGKGLTKEKRIESGHYPVFGSSGQVGKHSESLTKKSTLIIGRKGSVGEVHYSPLPCWPIDTTYYVEEQDNLHLKFFAYLLKGLNLGKLDKSTAVPGLSRDDYNAVQVAVAPFNEQNLIVSEIEKQFSRLDEAVAALKRVWASLKRYKASVLKAAVEGKLVTTSEQKKWKTTTVGEVSEVVTKGSSPNWQGFEYSSEGIVFVRSQNVSWGHLDLSDVAHLPLAFNKKEKKSVLKAGDVLLNIVGASIGRAAVATKSIEGGNINQAVAVIRPLRDRLLPKFLMCYFLSEKVQKLIHAQKVDVARANYSLDQIRKLLLHLPPLDDQH